MNDFTSFFFTHYHILKKNQYVNKLQIKQDLIIRFMNQFINFKTN